VPGLYSKAVKIHLDTDSTALLTGNSEERHPGLPSFAGAAFIEIVKLEGDVVMHVEHGRVPRPTAYPNPFFQKLNLQCHRKCSATLLTLQGQAVGKFIEKAETASLTLEASDLAEGIYLVELKDGEQLYRFRVLKVRE
jgi:hypothetical protein